MKLTRRRFIRLAGAVCAVACADKEVLVPDGIEDAGPDPTFDATPIDPDAALDDDATAPDDAPPDDAAFDAARDAGVIANPDFRSLPERAAQFPLGVMAGDATDTSVMFWTRHEGSGTLTLRVLEMNGSRVAAVRFNGAVTPAGGGFVRAVVNGLRPNRQHLYAFLVGPTSSPNGQSLVGRVQTAPAPDALVPLTFAGRRAPTRATAPSRCSSTRARGAISTSSPTAATTSTRTTATTRPRWPSTAPSTRRTGPPRA